MVATADDRARLAALRTYGDSKTRRRLVEALDDIDHRLAGAIDVTAQAVARIEKLFANSIWKPQVRMPIRAFLRHHWPAITITVTAAAIGCSAFVMLGNMPPHRIVMATGPEGSAYYEDGKRYRAALAKAGVEVQLIST